MLSYKPWKGESVLRLVLGLFVAFAIGCLLAAGVDKFGTGLGAERRQFLQTVCMTVSFQGLGLLLVRRFLYEESLSWSAAFGFNTPPRRRVLSLGVLAGFVVLPFAWGLQELSVYIFTQFQYKTAPQEIIKTIEKLQSNNEPAFHQVYLFVVAVLVAPVIEEMLFRGILYPTIKQFGFPRLAFWGTSALFSISHANVQTFLPLLFFAAMLTLLYEETDNLLAPITAHACFNAANFLLLVFRDEITRLFDRFL